MAAAARVTTLAPPKVPSRRGWRMPESTTHSMAALPPVRPVASGASPAQRHAHAANRRRVTSPDGASGAATEPLSTPTPVAHATTCAAAEPGTTSE